jgi:hypothetical protein
MPHFCPTCGSDDYLCQRCARVFCECPDCPKARRAHRVPGVGNVCSGCMPAEEAK